MKKIHIGGVYYGMHNVGDEAILYSMINSFDKDNKVSVSSYDSYWIDECFGDVERHLINIRYQKPKFGIYTLPRRKALSDFWKVKKEIQYLKSKDAYICGGATILSDCPWYSLRTVQLAEMAYIPSFLWGVGMAEIDDDETLKYISTVLNKSIVKKIYTRDELVKDRLINIGVEEKKLGVCYDPAIMIRGREYELRTYLSDKQIDLYKNGKVNIVVTVSGEADVIKRTPIDVIINAIKIIHQQYDANVFLIPTGCGIHCKDYEILESMANRINSERIIAVKKEFAPNDLVEFLKNVKLIISSRLHMNIFGACAGVPSIGLVRNRKIIDFASLLGLPFLEIEKLSETLILEITNLIMNNYIDYQENIINVVEKMRKQYVNANDEMQNLLNKNILY